MRHLIPQLLAPLGVCVPLLGLDEFAKALRSPIGLVSLIERVELPDDAIIERPEPALPVSDGVEPFGVIGGTRPAQVANLVPLDLHVPTHGETRVIKRLPKSPLPRRRLAVRHVAPT